MVTITGRLSRLTSVGDWVTSVLTARVNDVVKDTSRDVAKPGTRIQFGEEGGEVTIDATHVTAVVPGVRPMRVGHRYLVAFWTSDRGLTASPRRTYEITPSGALRRLVERPAGAPEHEDDVQDYWESDVIGRMRHIIETRRP